MKFIFGGRHPLFLKKFSEYLPPGVYFFRASVDSPPITRFLATAFAQISNPIRSFLAIFFPGARMPIMGYSGAYDARTNPPIKGATAIEEVKPNPPIIGFHGYYTE